MICFINGQVCSHQTAITIYCLLTKENNFCFLFSANNRRCCFPLIPFSVYIYILKLQQKYIYIERDRYAAISKGKWKTMRFSFIHPFTIASSCKQKFIFCPFVSASYRNHAKLIDQGCCYIQLSLFLIGICSFNFSSSLVYRKGRTFQMFFAR
jgi:hypothetical protein